MGVQNIIKDTIQNNNSDSNFTGKFVMVLGTTGAGKGTMIGLLKENCVDIIFPKSATTRTMRPGEVEGDVYYFLSEEEFEKRIEDDEFLEYAFVHKAAYYGVFKEEVFRGLRTGKTVVREIDYQGYLAVKDMIPKENLKSIFIMPPEVEVLKQRLKDRAPISDEELEKRINSIEEEMKVAAKCDIRFEPIDGDIEKSFELFEKLIQE